MRVLEGWVGVAIAAGEHQVPYVVSPEQRVYRYAFSWEKPTLVIDADILPPEHHIRLVRIVDKDLQRSIHKALRKGT